MPIKDWSSGSRLKLRHLQLVASIAKLGSLGSAAQSLHMTQPAASRLLAEIEIIVGSPIFDRLPRGLSPNVYGEALVRHAQSILINLREAGNEIELLKSGLAGNITFGFVSEAAINIAAPVLTDALKNFPSLKLTVEVAPSISLIRKALDGEIDIALARLPASLDTSSLDYREVGDEELSFVVRSDHRLAKQHQIELSDLVDEYWVMESPRTMLRKAVDDAFRRTGLPPPVNILNTSSLIFSISAIEKGNIIGALPSAVANIFEHDNRFCKVKLKETVGRISVEPYGVVRSRFRTPSPAANFMYEKICHHIFG